jgi:hypothetical protein
MTVEEYLSSIIAAQLTHELEPILKMKEVTRNTELLGSYTEAVVRRLSSRVVHPWLRVSTGAVIDYPLPEMLRQLDVVLWAPHPAPGIYEVGDFALVPRSSAFGVIEIKRSNYSGVDSKLAAFLQDAPDLVYEGQEVDSLGMAMGVISVIEGTPSALLKLLLERGIVVAFFERRSSDDAELRAKDVLRFINFLHRVKRSYHRTITMGPPIGLNTNF